MSNAPDMTTILVVDDEPDLRELLSYDLKSSGYQVVEAESGNHALAVLGRNKAEVIVSDLKMPNGDGIELLDRVKTLNPDRPIVVFVTGYSNFRVDDLYDRGAEALFSKPINFPALLEVIKSALTARNERWVRRGERIRVKTSIELCVPPAVDAYTTETVNIGRGGMFVACPEPRELPKADDLIHFSLDLPGRKVSFIEGEGIVRWIRLKTEKDLVRGFGIEFSHLDDKCRAAVTNFINEVRTKAFIPRA